MKKTVFIFVHLIVIISFSACVPFQKKVVAPVESEDISKKQRESAPSPSKSPSRKRVMRPSFSVPESFQLELEKRYQRQSPDKIPEIAVEEDLAAESDSLLVPDYKRKDDVPSKKFVQQRLQVYDAELERWNNAAARAVTLEAENLWPDGWHECVQGLEFLLYGYSRLLDLCSPDESGQPGAAKVNPWDVLSRDIQYQESECKKLLQQGKLSNDGLLSEYSVSNKSQMEFLIDSYMEKGNYQEVVSSYANYTNFEEDQKIDLSLKCKYAEALVRLGRLQEAQEFLEPVLKAQGLPAPVLKEKFFRDLQVVISYADLLLVIGEKEKALEIYSYLEEVLVKTEEKSDWVVGQLQVLADFDKNSDEYSDYAKLLELYLRSDVNNDSAQMREVYEKIIGEYDHVALEGGARRIMRKHKERANLWTKEQLARVKELAAERDYSAAKAILAVVQKEARGAELEVSALLEQITAEEQDYLLLQYELERQRLESRWEKAVSLYQQKKYAVAIDAFAALMATDYRNKAESEMVKAINGYAKTLRREAAKIFVKAQKATDENEKKELFNQSRMILVNFLDKYPKAEAASKIEKNIATLDEQLSRF